MLFKKYWSHLLELSDLKLFFIRYFVNLIVFCEVLLLPFMLDPLFYSKIEFLRNAFLLAPILLLGAHSGYLFVLYNYNKDYRIALMFFSMIVGAITSVAVFLIIGSALAGLAVFFVVVVNSFEKITVAENRLVLASVHKSFISLFMLTMCLICYLFDLSVVAISIYSISIIAGLSVWLLLIFIGFSSSMSSHFVELKKKRELVRQSSELILQGFALNIQSYVLVAYLLFDRYITNSAYSEHSAEFAIALSLSQIIFIALNTISFSAQQRVGVNIKTISLKEYHRLVKLTGIFFGVLSVVSMFLVYGLSFFLVSYGHFIYSFFIVMLLMGGYYTLSAFSIVAFYKKRSRSMLLALLGMIFLNTSLSYCFVHYGVNYYANLVKSGVLLLMSAIIVDRLIRRALINE